MKIKVLGCSGSELPDFHPPAFLIDEGILLDAGTVTAALDEDSQSRITHIFITHPHLDHIRSIPSLADNMLVKNWKHKIVIIGIKEVLKSLKENLLNNSIWPDFTAIPDSKEPVLRLKAIETGKRYNINGYSIIAEKVKHSVPAVGYIIKDSKGKSLLYTGDTGPSSDLWKRVNSEMKNTAIDGAIIEVTFPNRMKELAIKTGHLNPALFFDELKKLKRLPQKIFITHPKPQFSKIIIPELRSLKIKQITMLKEGKTYNI
ncbi:MAG: 3',5'-cyclic-nucleotide phosphodiesterase [Nitrospirae bacterium]|nr:3',5'-cyclic-nucleotide phosphodiesterase [Nitrospirota bacterium]